MTSKFKVLVAEDEEMIASLYEMIISSEFNCEIVLAKDGQEAIDILKNDSSVNMILTDYTMPNKNGVELYLFARDNCKIPTIFVTGKFRIDLPGLSTFDTDNILNAFIQKPFQTDELLETIRLVYDDFIQKSPGIQITEIPINQFDEFIKSHQLTIIPLNILKRYGFNAIDVFVKIHSDKLTKIIAKENSFSLDQKTIDDYESRGFREAFIEKQEFKIITKHMLNQLTIKARQQKKISPLDIAGLQVNVSLHNLKDFGINEDQINSVNEILEETIQTVFSDKAIESKIKELMQGYSYHTSHCVLLMYVASNILKKTTLPFQNTLKKISLASFFHDLSIDNEAAENEFMGLDPRQEPPSLIKKKLLAHPQASAELLKKSAQDIFHEAQRIIEEHHELPDGTGYPRGLNSSQISPLTALFIISHDIANNFYRNEYNKDDLKNMLANLESKYSQGPFKNFFEAAKTAFMK